MAQKCQQSSYSKDNFFWKIAIFYQFENLVGRFADRSRIVGSLINRVSNTVLRFWIPAWPELSVGFQTDHWSWKVFIGVGKVRFSWKGLWSYKASLGVGKTQLRWESSMKLEMSIRIWMGVFTYPITEQFRYLQLIVYCNFVIFHGDW